MVRVSLLLLLSLSLFAGSLQERIIHLIGKKEYDQNRIILHTVFLHPDRFYSNGHADLVKILKVLDRLGFFHQSEKRRKFSLHFFSFNEPLLFQKIVKSAMAHAGIYRYEPTRLSRDHDGLSLLFSFTSLAMPDPVKIASFLQDHGSKLLDIRKDGDRWSYILDCHDTFIDAKPLEARVEISHVKEPLWLKVEKAQKIIVHSHRHNHWFAKIYIYDRHLHPISLFQKDEATQKVVLSLPKDSYYIKISDKFLIKNIKRGFTIETR